MSDAFEGELAQDTVIMFEQFALVLGLIIIGMITFIYGALPFNDLDTLKRLSFLFFAITGFFALPDLINVFTGQPSAPLPVIIMGLVFLGLFYYVCKKGTI
jgi:predicted membrane channel-forming protein YqfA (hemolysin III family)